MAAIRPSIGDVDGQAVALASFAAAVAGYYGRPDIRSSDWQNDPSFTPWVSRLLGQVDTAALSAGTPLATMAVRPALDIAATTDVELTAVGGDRFAVNYPEPSMWVEAVDGGARPHRGARRRDRDRHRRPVGCRLGRPGCSHPVGPGCHDDARPPNALAGVDVMNATKKALLALAAASLVAAACTGGDDSAGDDDEPGTSGADGPDEVDTGDCIVVDMAVSSEKIALLEDLADEFNDSDAAEVDGRCIVVRPRSVASGLAATLIPEGWPNPDANGEPPVIWSPAASAWAGIVNDRAGQELAPPGTPFMLTPLVIAMPRPMAEALGWPAQQLGFADLLHAEPEPRGVGRGRPPGVGTVPPRQDEPELLDERAQLHDRRVLRGRRQDRRA